jgi:hypothetical protein
MFSPRKLQHYFSKLPYKLQKKYGKKSTYSATEIRETVFKCDFNVKYLPLGYLMFLPKDQARFYISTEFPNFSFTSLQAQITHLIEKKPQYLQTIESLDLELPLTDISMV